MLSNGPGDPKENARAIETIKVLLQSGKAVFGICLGHQLLALANGFQTGKLKYGHRGANQPAKDLKGGRTYITSQNHGYATLSETIDRNIAEEWFVNNNDQTNEGILYKNAPAFSVQFHPEACGGPRDTSFLFDKFIDMMEDGKNAAR
jgi:carbamoyl-phosphate synthase small subunit